MFSTSKKIFKNKNGIAMLLAIFALVTLVAIITEVTYDSNVEYVVNAKAVSQLKAHYAAKSGLELSLLRIKIYQSIQAKFGKQLSGQSKYIDLIWSFPFSWPPILPEELDGIQQEQIQATVKDSLMDATYQATILNEDSKIDLNDLVSPSENLRKATKERLIGLVTTKIDDDEKWANKNRNLDAEKVVNNIIDWLDADTEGLNGGSESQQYENSEQRLPPNRAFRTLGELRMVAGMTDDIFQLFSENVTIYGSKSINPNYAPVEVIRSLDPTITKECGDEVIKRRNSESLGGFFKDANEFWDFVNTHGGNVAPESAARISLIFDSISNFRIKSVGVYANSSQQIEAVVYDIDKAATNLAELVKKEKAQEKEQEKPADPGKTPPKPASSPAPNNSSKGPPRIVYWNQN